MRESVVAGEVIEGMTEAECVMRGEMETAVAAAGEVEGEESAASEGEEIVFTLQGIPAGETGAVGGIVVEDHGAAVAEEYRMSNKKYRRLKV